MKILFGKIKAIGVQKFKNWYLALYQLYIESFYIRYIIPLLLCATVIILLCMISESNWSILISLVSGVFFSKFTHFSGEIMYWLSEDIQKINRFKEQYEKEYKIDLYFSGNHIDCFYKPLLIFDEEIKMSELNIDVEDRAKKYFRPDAIVEANYSSLLYAHRNDIVSNYDCIRLDDLKIDVDTSKITFYTSRAKCFDHLVTNFAMDYKMERGMTIRAIYEYANTLTPLASSKMANVLGVNALVFLGDGTLLLALRGKGATISKNMLTSSIALGCFRNNEDSGKEITQQELIWGYIYQGLRERLFISETLLKGIKKKICFLGLGRDVSWGGKPQLYYYISLDMTAEQYLLQCSNGQNANLRTLDRDREILLVKTVDLIKNTDYLKLKCINKKELLENKKIRFYNKICKAECSFFNNCYHFSRFNNYDEFSGWFHDEIIS